MFARVAGVLLAGAVALSAAHDFSGAWKLNTAKSKYTGAPKPKDLTATYTIEGNGYRYEAKGTSEDGQPISRSYVYVKDNDEIKTTGFPNGDALVLKNVHADVATGVVKRDGKVVGHVKRVLSKDGKTMTITADTVLPDRKKSHTVSVYEKQ